MAAYLLTRPKKVVVPGVTGEQFSVAQAQLQNAGFKVNEISVTNQKPAGTVIAQDPLAGAKVKEGSTVTLTVSTGPGNATVPSVVGETAQPGQVGDPDREPEGRAGRAPVEHHGRRGPGDRRPTRRPARTPR